MPSHHTNPNAIVSRGRRHFFFIPWRDHMLIGSSHQVYAGTPDEYAVTEKDIQDLIDEVNACYPAADLTRGDVSFCNAGLVPMDEHVPGSGEVRLSTRCRLIDHESIDGVPGLVSVVGVRYTTARLVAQQTIDLVFRRLGYKPPKAMTAVMPLYGGRIERFGEFSRQESARRPYRLSPDVMDHLLHHHGSAYPEVLRYLDGSLDLRETIGTSPVIKAEVVHAVRAEMAQKLGDVVFRRTDLGAAGDPGDPALRTCAALMAAELGWDASRMRKELDEVRTAFP
jgi:glycerol-3-phosphate dehydrogenase